MKKQLLQRKNQLQRLVLCIMAIAFIGAASAKAQTINSITIKQNNVALAENDNIALGSDIEFEVNCTVPSDGETYRLVFMQLGGLGTNTNPTTWVTDTKITLAAGTADATGTFTVKTTNNNGSKEALTGSGYFRCRLWNSGGNLDPIVELDFAVNWVSGDPISEITSATYTGEPNVEIGNTVSFSVDYTLVDDAIYTLQVMQNCVTATSAPSATWVKTTTYDLATTAGSYNFTGDFATITNHPTKGDCEAGEGNVQFRLRKDGNAIQDIRVTTTYTTTTTDIGSVGFDNFKIFPNPATSSTSIKTDIGSKVEICNVAGAVVHSFISDSEVEKIDVSQLVKGLYVVKLSVNGASTTQKLLIK